eukprot:TRINITY_DN3018_c0_g1_i1.p1 TRINITY_DN3018_c0_g1~~TRINITY_DN3018_c0_g1_i1.p1  ORF type:complete len:395 (+),score=88.55 TRINITY_DN3018_c0_g1_i1:413-1597(+)
MVEKKKRKSIGSGKKLKNTADAENSEKLLAESGEAEKPTVSTTSAPKKKKVKKQKVEPVKTEPPPVPMDAEETDATPAPIDGEKDKEEQAKEEVKEENNDAGEEQDNKEVEEDAAAEEEEEDEQEKEHKAPSFDDTNYVYEKSDIENLVSNFAKEELVGFVKSAFEKHPDLTKEFIEIAAKDPSKRKVFVRGLSWETKSETLNKAFASFGDIERAEVVTNKEGKCRGYGFVTFKTLAGALRAVKEPDKKIGGRVAVTQLSSASSEPITQHKDQKKIYVAGLPEQVDAEKLTKLFSQYGDIEEGPIGVDKKTGKCKGYAFFIYKSAESAKKALEQPSKKLDDLTLYCKYGDTKQKNVSQQQQPRSYTQVGSVGYTPQVILGGPAPHFFPQMHPYY